MKKIMLINDFPSYGKVALSAMNPVLSHMGYDLFNLPTALVSNTLDYGKFQILETTDYMRETINVWKSLNFSVDAICVGFIVSNEQVKFITDICNEEIKKGTTVFLDPIMGDEGKLYNGITEETVEHMRELAYVADYLIPNYTEATYIAKEPYKEKGITEEEGKSLIDKLRKECGESIVITSINLMGKSATMGYDHREDVYFTIPFEYLPVRFPGTGDIFSAFMSGSVMDGKSLQESVALAMENTSALISMNKGNEDKYKGIPIEMSLGKLERKEY